MRNGDELRESYVVKGFSTDWNGNKIAIVGRFEIGDEVVVSKRFRDSLKERYPGEDKRLCGIHKVEYVSGFGPIPRYRTGGLAQYTVNGSRFLIPDDDLSLVTERERKENLNLKINKVLHDKFPSMSVEIGMAIKEDVLVELALNTETVPVSENDITMAVDSVIARRIGAVA